MKAKTLLEKLEDKVLIGDGCWEWAASKNPAGYGILNRQDGSRLAHRIIYELLVGPVQSGCDLDHLCRNPACVNPGHLEAVSRQENIKRGLKGDLRTHCINGHEYTTDTLRVTNRGKRECRVCSRASNRRAYHRKTYDLGA
jgi:hypothetical protein